MKKRVDKIMLFHSKGDDVMSLLIFEFVGMKLAGIVFTMKHVRLGQRLIYVPLEGEEGVFKIYSVTVFCCDVFHEVDSSDMSLSQLTELFHAGI